jgi:hypothetical protein
MLRHLKLLYPFCFAAFPLLSMVGHNVDEVTLGDVATVLAATVGGTAVLFALAYLIARRDLELAAALTMLVVIWVVFVPGGETVLAATGRWFRRSALAQGALLPGVGLLVLGAVGWWLLKRRPRLEVMSRFLAIMGVVLVAMSLVRLTRIKLANQRRIAHSELVRELAAPVAARPVRPGERKPDIYLVLLDGYGSNEVLREFYGFDNRAFEDSLRQLGFAIPPVVRSNYTRSVLSIPSLLNFAHMNVLERELGKSRDQSLLYHLLESNRAARFLKSRGYRFYLFPSADWSGTQRSPLADSVFRAWPERTLSRALRRTNLRKGWIRVTMLKHVINPNADDDEFILRTYRGLSQVPRDTAPTFTFAHFLSPHRPYVLDSRCRPAVRSVRGPMRYGSPEDLEAYLAQVRCMNRLTLQLVRELLRTSEEPPVILLQSDHGTLTTRYWGTPPEQARPEQIRERFGAFGAYYLPDGGTPADTMTVVNVLRYVFRAYFGAELPPLPDDQYYSVPSPEPYRFVRVNPPAEAHTSAPQ